MQAHAQTELLKKECARQLWLSYYNQVLFESGIITEGDRNRMRLKITAPSSSAAEQADPRARSL